MPPQYQPTPQPISPPPAPARSGKSSQTQRMIIRSLVMVIVGIVLLFGGWVIGHSTSKKPTPNVSSNNNQSQSLQPAQSLDVDQANNSISQDIASLHDDTDLPATTLTDQSLGL